MPLMSWPATQTCVASAAATALRWAPAMDGAATQAEPTKRMTPPFWPTAHALVRVIPKTLLREDVVCVPLAEASQSGVGGWSGALLLAISDDGKPTPDEEAPAADEEPVAPLPEDDEPKLPDETGVEVHAPGSMTAQSSGTGRMEDPFRRKACT